MGITFLGARAATYAAISTFFSVIFTVIAFSTPYWLAADGKSSRRTFLNLGLWEACFTSFRDPNYQYDRELRGCKWLFDEDYTFLLDVLEPRKSHTNSNLRNRILVKSMQINVSHDEPKFSNSVDESRNACRVKK